MKVRPLRWGFIGAGANALESVAPAVHRSPNAVLQAVASRSAARAQALAPAGACYEQYQDLLHDPDVDAIYVGLANDAHAKWTLAALESGRPVLCEKPLALTAAEVDEISAAGSRTGTQVVEACWYRWHPRIHATQSLLGSGMIGAVRAVDARFSTCLSPAGYRFEAVRGGGAVFDLACYVVSAALWAFSEYPVSLGASWEMGMQGVDVEAEARLRFPSGTARLGVGFAELSEQLVIEGDKGRLELPDAPFTANKSRTCRIRIVLGPCTHEVEFESPDVYEVMITEVSRRFQGRSGWLLPLDQTRACAAVVDAWRSSATAGSTVVPVALPPITAMMPSRAAGVAQ